jgi:hypothetical protein
MPLPSGNVQHHAPDARCLHGDVAHAGDEPGEPPRRSGRRLNRRPLIAYYPSVNQTYFWMHAARPATI